MKKSLMIAAAAAIAFGGTATDAFAGIEGKCKACHTFEEGGRNKMGPNLFGIVGKEAGQVEGYRYSDDLKNSGLTWDEETLREWIDNSKELVSGTKMPPQRVTGERADQLIEYMKSFQ